MYLFQNNDPRETHDCAAPRWLENFERKGGGNYFELLLMVYLFVGMAVVIDQRLVPAIQQHLSERDIPQGLMGATMLAFANASPEVFISFISTAATGQTNEGVGAVIGSVVFNLLVVTGVVVLMAPGSKVEIGDTVMRRDVPFFCLVLTITMVVFARNMAGLTESVLLFLCYPAYIIYLYFSYGTSDPDDDPLLKGSSAISEGDDDEAGSSSIMQLGFVVLYYCTRPWQIVFAAIFNDHFKNSFAVTFILSILCIALLSSMVLYLVKRVVCGLDLNGDLVGLTLLGVGLAVPNTLSNGLIAKQGYTDMAISSTLNSNVAGILLGMAGPWAVLNLVNGNPVKLVSPELKASFIFLVAATSVFVVSIIATKQKIKSMHGKLFIGLYLIFFVLMLSGAFNSVTLE